MADETHEREVLRLAAVLAAMFLCPDVRHGADLTPALADAEADRYLAGTQTLQRLWPEYVAAARHAIELIHAPETAPGERAEAVRRIEEIIRADEERERAVLAGVS